MTVTRLLHLAVPLLALSVAAAACGGAPATAASSSTVPVTTVAPKPTAATVAPTTVAPTTVAPVTTPITTPAPVYVPVPVYETPPTVYVPPTPQAPVDPSIWEYAPLASYIVNSVYVHSTTSLTSSPLDQVYVGQELGVICSVQGQEVTQYEDSTQWDYVQSPNDVYGWVADQFINVVGPDVPAC